MRPVVEAKITKRTEVPGKVLYTVELDGEAYVAVVFPENPRECGPIVGGVLHVRTMRKVRSSKVVRMIERVVKGG